MAIYHWSAQILSRAKGQSVVCAAAYRSGSKLRNFQTGKVADYSRTKSRVIHSEIIAPSDAHPDSLDREKLWNAVERQEKRKDAQLAREINIALPYELSDAERLTLVRDYIRSEFLSRRMIADFAIHRPAPDKGEDPRNYHAHIMLTLREATAAGLRPVKTRGWNSKSLLAHWRESWTCHHNRALEQAGHQTRIDHRTLKAQHNEAIASHNLQDILALDRLPEIHMGQAATRLSRKGKSPKLNSSWKNKSAKRYQKFGSLDRVSANLNRISYNANRADQFSRTFRKAESQSRQQLFFFNRQNKRRQKHWLLQGRLFPKRQDAAVPREWLIQKLWQAAPIIALLAFLYSDAMLLAELRRARADQLKQRYRPKKQKRQASRGQTARRVRRRKPGR